MLIHFTKMHGLGNDFVVIDGITQSVTLYPSHIKRIANRNQGIGCDQVLWLEPPRQKTADFYLRFFNANGVEVEQCGNGVRCAARFFYDFGFTNRRTLHIDCLAGNLKAFIEDDKRVTVNMGIPKTHPNDIPFMADEDTLLYPLTLNDIDYSFSVVSMGNPHAVLTVPDIQNAPLNTVGPLISQHPYFPKQTNVGFMEVVNRSHIRLRVFERGVGETLSCGSGACAAVCAGIRLGILESPVRVSFTEGDLDVHWANPKAPLYMTGPAVSVFAGRFCL